MDWCEKIPFGHRIFPQELLAPQRQKDDDIELKKKEGE